MTKKEIVVSVTCYDNEDEVIEFAKMMNSHAGENISLVVTTNSVKDVVVFEKRIKEVKSNTVVYKPNNNLGYLNGCLYGASQYIESHSVDYIMITNTDVSFSDSDFFAKISQIELGEDIWCIGPNVVRASNKAAQNPFMIKRPSKRKMCLYRTIYSYQILYSLFVEIVKLKRIIMKREKKEADSGKIYASDGSCFILSKTCACKVFELSSNIMMYGEEVLVAEVVYSNRKMEWYLDNLHVVHHANSATGLMNLKRKQRWYKESFTWLYNTFFR